VSRKNIKTLKLNCFTPLFAFFDKDQQIDAFVKKWLGEAYGDFLREFMGVCGYNPEASSLPVEVTFSFRMIQ
jgi:hypothetical protein